MQNPRHQSDATAIFCPWTPQFHGNEHPLGADSTYIAPISRPEKPSRLPSSAGPNSSTGGRSSTKVSSQFHNGAANTGAAKIQREFCVDEEGVQTMDMGLVMHALPGAIWFREDER
jgi:hypothetical protein